MQADDLNEIQIAILKLVREDGGRTATEGVYDLVEEARPTVDEDGEPLDEDVDPYQTSREELGALERAGLLAADWDTGWVMGATLFTDAGRKMADEVLGRE